MDTCLCGAWILATQAGLWDAWKDPANGQWLQSYAIITPDANELMAQVHNRPPPWRLRPLARP
jgi:putative SOS response-associated peptidase YedK